MFHLLPSAIFEGVSYQRKYTLYCAFLWVLCITPPLSLVYSSHTVNNVWSQTSCPSTWSLGFHVWIKGKWYRGSQWSFSPWSMGFMIHFNQWGHRLCAIRVTAWCFYPRVYFLFFISSLVSRFKNFHSWVLLPSSPEVNLPQVLDTSLLQFLWCLIVQILL